MIVKNVWRIPGDYCMHDHEIDFATLLTPSNYRSLAHASSLRDTVIRYKYKITILTKTNID